MRQVNAFPIFLTVLRNSQVVFLKSVVRQDEGNGVVVLTGAKASRTKSRLGYCAARDDLQLSRTDFCRGQGGAVPPGVLQDGARIRIKDGR